MTLPLPEPGPPPELADLDTRIRSELLPGLEVLRPLGQGMHALVYLAREPDLQRLVVVKVLRPELASNRVTRRRFEREAQAAARLAHTNVPLIHHVARLPGDVPYIVMEFIEGRTLAEVVDSVGPLSLEQAPATRAADLPVLLLSVGAAGASEPVASEPASPFVAFLADLKRRRVYQVGIAYLAVGFAVVEIANNFFPPLHVPAWATTVVAAMVVVGFPAALALSWLYDITDSDLRRTEASGAPGAARPFTRALPWVALALSAIVALLMGKWLL